MQKLLKVFIIGKVWPEPKSSAAGSRMMQLIQMMKERGYVLHFGSAASETDHSEDISGLIDEVHSLKMNDSSFDELISNICPNVVIYDRFMTEEQFGWRVHEHCPNALKVLNTEDLHFLRAARERNPHQMDFHHDETWRELASLFRCDLNLIISEAEMDLLVDHFQFSADRLHYLPLLFGEPDINTPGFEERNAFCTIGNLLHKPNLDAVCYLKKDLWPLIRQIKAEAQLHIYGAYMPESVRQMHNPKEGFNIEGRAESVEEVLRKHKVMLAPLRFGAGLKGKLLESIFYGLPSITTSIGAEGIESADLWPGNVSEDMHDFAEQAVQLHENADYWNQCQAQGFELINTRFNKTQFENSFLDYLENIHRNLTSFRKSNYIGGMLRHQSLASTKFMGKWIEEKNRVD